MTEKIATMYPAMRETSRIETTLWNIEKNHQLFDFFITLSLLDISDSKKYEVELFIENQDTKSPKEVHSYNLNSSAFKGKNNQLADGNYSASITASFKIALVEGTYHVLANLKDEKGVVAQKECDFYVKKVGNLA